MHPGNRRIQRRQIFLATSVHGRDVPLSGRDLRCVPPSTGPLSMLTACLRDLLPPNWASADIPYRLRCAQRLSESISKSRSLSARERGGSCRSGCGWSLGLLHHAGLLILRFAEAGCYSSSVHAGHGRSRTLPNFDELVLPWRARRHPRSVSSSSFGQHARQKTEAALFPSVRHHRTRYVRVARVVDQRAGYVCRDGARESRSRQNDCWQQGRQGEHEAEPFRGCQLHRAGSTA